MDSYSDLTSLCGHSKVPIAGGELHTSGLAELKMMIEHHCYDVFQPDAMFAGGIAQVMQVIRLCKDYGLQYSPHTWTNGIGFAVNLQLMIASGFADTKELEYPISPPGWTPEARDGILEETFSHSNSMIAAPTRPGLGFTINRKALRRHGKRFFKMNKLRLIWYSVRDKGLRRTLEINKVKKAKAKGQKKALRG